MAMANISPEESLWLCASYWIRGVHNEVSSTNDAARQSARPAHLARHAFRAVEIKGDPIV